MSDILIHGDLDRRFEPVRDVMRRLFEAGEEQGAAFAAVIDGEPVLELWAGRRDKGRTPEGADYWTEDTLAPIFSCSKALASLVVAWCVDRGLLDYDAPLSAYWPEFAQAGKGEITLAQALSHQAGVSGITEPFDPAEWLDWDAMAARIAAQAPLWDLAEGGTGYHPLTHGWITGMAVRAGAGRSLGAILREEFAQPLMADVWIGLPDAEHHRVARLQPPRRLPDFGPGKEAVQAAFLNKWSAYDGSDPAAWRRAEIPSASGCATALGLAKVMNVIAGDGAAHSHRYVSKATIAAFAEPRVSRPDRVLPYDLTWAAGVMLNSHGFYGPNKASIGHSGWGGSCCFADRQARLSAAYVMNRQSHHLLGDPRPRALIDALYDCL